MPLCQLGYDLCAVVGVIPNHVELVRRFQEPLSRAAVMLCSRRQHLFINDLGCARRQRDAHAIDGSFPIGHPIGVFGALDRDTGLALAKRAQRNRRTVNQPHVIAGID